MNLKDFTKWIRNLPIRWRLLYSYLGTFLLLAATASTIVYFHVRSSIHESMDSELSNSLKFSQRLIQSAAKSSINGHLKLIVEKNVDILVGIYQLNIADQAAKKRAIKIMASQSVGTSGELYAINSRGIIQAHPDEKTIGRKLADAQLIDKQVNLKNGYLEYRRKNEDSGAVVNEALYMSYFGPWDWIVTAAFPQLEFKSLLQFQALSKTLLNRRFGKSGDTFVIDSKGNAVIHAELSGENIFNLQSADGRKYIQEICEKKNGKMFHAVNGSEGNGSRKQMVRYGYIAELDWIVVTSAYLDEMYQPLGTLRLLILAMLSCVAFLVLSLTWYISGSITRPVRYLMAGIRAAAAGDFSTRLKPKSVDELGQLESYFNSFLSQLQESNSRLQESERSFRSIFENAVEGIFQFDLDGNIIKMNPSFVAMLGYSSRRELLEDKANLPQDFIVIKGLWKTLVEEIISERAVKGMEMQIYRKSGEVFWCLLNARGIYESGSDNLIMIEGFLSDITDKRIAQEGQEKMMEDLEVMVDQRTAELSNRIAELEQRDQINRFLAEMADMLQSCRSTKETYPVINQYLKTFFPEDACALYLHDSSRQMIDRVIPPVSAIEPYVSMTNESCWALRQGKIYLYKDTMEEELTCEHVEHAPGGYICIPLIAQGVTMGLLHIVFHHDEEAEDDTEVRRSIKRKTRISGRLAEHLSLALANLRLQEKLQLKSNQDSLTKLANRRHMEDILQRQFFRMLRHNTPCSIVMLDVDHFKQFNDTYGHDLGDCVLKELGAYLKKNTRGEDMACRYGGEEFIVILVDTDMSAAKKKAERMRAEIEQDISIHHYSEKLRITVSMGVAAGPQHGKNSAELIKSADKALYKAKANGRNRVEVSGEGTENSA